LAKLVAVQLETNHDNADSTAWYAYFDGEVDTEGAWQGAPAYVAGLRAALRRAASADGAPLGLEFDGPPAEAPSALSRHAGLRRYRVAAAV